jgi:UDP-2-acetamido-2,6-beta-L-arabino-hexul-4-ose reductase
MNILVTGSNGFIGKNLIATLRHTDYFEIFEFNKETEQFKLDFFCKEADFVFHLAGINKAEEESDFMNGNYYLTSEILRLLKKHNNNCPVMFSSSIQADLDNPYGKSKKAAEDLVFSHGKEIGSKIFVYRLPNVFGKWCRPNYNSVIATFCYNVLHDLPVKVNNPDVLMNLVYIDDLVEELLKILKHHENTVSSYYEVPIVHTIKLREILDIIYSFKKSRIENKLPEITSEIIKKLHSTYLSYLPFNKMKYDLKMNIDNRGSFTEFIKTDKNGQISINISKPMIVKGNHWHHSKHEKFLVVNGVGVIRLRNYNSNEVIEYFVSGEKLEVIDIPSGYIHNIENVGNSNLVTIMWVNEIFDINNPDTFSLEV